MCMHQSQKSTLPPCVPTGALEERTKWCLKSRQAGVSSRRGTEDGCHSQVLEPSCRLAHKRLCAVLRWDPAEVKKAHV